MHRRPILIIHPFDNTTTFLNKIKNHLIVRFNENVHHFNVYPNDKSHDDCLGRISSHPKNGIIIFLGHGRSDLLAGAKGKCYDTLASSDAMLEFPDKYYYKDNFINKNNIEVFSGKKVFCLACNSNNKIANYAVDKGTQTFLGFGDIPTSIAEFAAKNDNVSNELVIKMKSELNYIIKTSLAFGIEKGLTFEGLLNLIKFITNQRLTDILINQKTIKERSILADYLYYFKKEAIIVGKKQLRLLE